MSAAVPSLPKKKTAPAEGAGPRPDPVSELLKNLDQKQLTKIFGSGGHIAQVMAAHKRSFESRPEQLEMASAISTAIRDRAHLLVEAGTGTGKSYAYLVPFILWALENKKRVLIATGTKALQQQLVERDLPFLAEVFETHLKKKFEYSLCLGTGNYVCPRRLSKAQVLGLFATQDDVKQLGEINDFARKSSTGRNIDMSFEPSPGLWAQVNRESDLCLGRACPLHEQSFYFKARREQEKAQILVANHHLLFAHLATGGNAAGVLPPFDALVIDEAHQAEDVAATYLGVEISNLGAARLIELISNRRSNRTVLQGVKWTEAKELEEKLRDAADEARAAVGRFFEDLQFAVRFEPNRSSNVRVRQPNLLENILDVPFERLESILKDARKIAERESDEALNRELDGFSERCGEIRKAAKSILTQNLPGYVYWASSVPRPSEGPGKTARVPRLSMHGAPIEVAVTMQKTLFDQFRPVVLTSATMTTGGSFDFLIERLGLSGPVQVEAKEGEKEKTPSEPFKVNQLILGSPFDYRKNALIYVGADLPDPAHLTYWEEASVKRAAEVIKRTDGRAFVLCTSFRMIDQTARFLEQVLPKHINVLRQGAMPRGRLLKEFRNDIHSVLVGTTSFWQGVDVPGESLSCVVIMKLPFAVPDEPLVQARVETLKSRGRDAFNEYQVPQAVMMFRQGFGRLIRTAVDRGVVAIMDPRVRTKNYGRTFLDSLPDCEVTHDLSRIESFFHQP